MQVQSIDIPTKQVRPIDIPGNVVPVAATSQPCVKCWLPNGFFVSPTETAIERESEREGLVPKWLA